MANIKLELSINFTSLDFDRNSLMEAISILEQNSDNKHLVQGLDSIYSLLHQIQDKASKIIGDEAVFGKVQ